MWRVARLGLGVAARTHSSLRAFPVAAEQERGRWYVFSCSSGTDPEVQYSPSQWQLRESGPRKCRHIFAVGLFRREAKHWACSFFLRFDALLGTWFSAHFGAMGGNLFLWIPKPLIINSVVFSFLWKTIIEISFESYLNVFSTNVILNINSPFSGDLTRVPCLFGVTMSEPKPFPPWPLGTWQKKHNWWLRAWKSCFVYMLHFIIFKSFLFMISCQYSQHQVPRIILLVSGRVLIRI